MPSVWLERRVLSSGGIRHRVIYRLGGHESKQRYGGSFKSKREATLRKAWIGGELAAMRVPNIGALAVEPPTTALVRDAGERWLASRIDVAESTKTRNRVEVGRIDRLLGSRPVDELTSADVQTFINALVDEKYKRGTMRKTKQTLGMILDYEGVEPNPVKHPSVKLPREEPEELNPPTAEHVEAVCRLLPRKHRLALLWLDWSGARVQSAVDLTLVSDYDEPRRRVRLRAATTKTRLPLWVELPDVLADELEAELGPREDRNPQARLFAGSQSDALRTAIAKACKAAAIPLFSPHDLCHRRISLLHAQGWSWARIGERVGRRDLKVLADTYTHVLTDETEVDYAALLSDATARGRIGPTPRPIRA
jgi:integrase